VTTVDLPVTNIFVYDLNGNLRTNGAQILDYDDENQLITNRAPNAWKSEFLYDGLHRRRIERDYGWNGSSWTLTNELRFIYDGSLIVQERDGNNLPETTLTRGLDLSGTFQGAGGIGGLLALTEQANNLLSPLCYHSDGNGSVTCLVNTNQLIVAQYLYDPFGKPLATWGPKANVNRYRFSSKPTNGRVGLYDFFRRWFAADLQRWITRDPIGEDGGIDLYEFCRNSPIDWFDPDGRGPTTKQGSEGHGNCLSYVLKQDDDKEGGIKPTKEEKANYGGIDPWLEAKLRAAGCREKGSSPCEKNESQVASLTGITKDDQGKDTFFFHVLVKRCGSEHWSERNGYNGPIVLDPDPVEKRQPGLKDRKAKQWCCPCKSR